MSESDKKRKPYFKFKRNSTLQNDVIIRKLFFMLVIFMFAEKQYICQNRHCP
jgi:hypothetical protein